MATPILDYENMAHRSAKTAYQRRIDSLTLGRIRGRPSQEHTQLSRQNIIDIDWIAARQHPASGDAFIFAPPALICDIETQDALPPASSDQLDGGVCAGCDWKIYFVYIGTLTGMIFLVYFRFPKNSGCTLEEIAIVFDSEAAEPEVYRRVSVGMELKGDATAVTEKHTMQSPSVAWKFCRRQLELILAAVFKVKRAVTSLCLRTPYAKDPRCAVTTLAHSLHINTNTNIYHLSIQRLQETTNTPHFPMSFTPTSQTELQQLRTENQTLRADLKAKDEKIEKLEKMEAAFAKVEKEFEAYRKTVEKNVEELERVLGGEGV
ncbi:hypothetical protein P171DRAFT_438028 [Karstenula rhodostoma CBS 690.94]|uniref:Uncharacterized protein n=1 Tax=Karstenula rhodostoma CBS 690.94 TaxID=1392251 RepID=A0A9P4PVM1_9PLEO|nr:hypothetical protein P171DRAFT_438028 [Karstenula rhodostoma CBS 690.94]